MKKKSSTEEKFTNQDFELFSAIEALDKKNYGYFSQLTEEQQRKFVPHMLLNWMSTISGAELLSRYYLLNTDASANKHMYNERVQNHPELQWLMLCAVSPGHGKQFHKYIPHIRSRITALKEPAKVQEIQDYFTKIYPKADAQVLKECSETFVANHAIKYKLAQIYPDMKLSDIEILSNTVTQADLDEYDRQSGN